MVLDVNSIFFKHFRIIGLLDWYNKKILLYIISYFLSKLLNTEAKLRLPNTSENTATKQLYQLNKKREEVSLELAKTRLRVGFESEPPVTKRF